MAHWNHRVVKKVYEDGTEEYSVRETHYNDAGEIYGYTVDPTDLACETIDDLRQYIQWCLDCLDKPVLDDATIIFAGDDISEEDLKEAKSFDNMDDFINDLKEN